MSTFARLRWRIGSATVCTLLALTVSLVFSLSLSAVTFASGGSLTQISSDPYTNTTSNHKTEVEPDTYAFGNTIVSAFQVGRFFNGGASNIGFSTSTDGGTTWTQGFLPSSTVYATPAGVYGRASDASVAYDPKHKVWMISWLGLRNPAPNAPVDVLVSRSTDGGLTFGPPVVVNASGDFNDKNWTACDTNSSSPFYGRCYTEYDDNTQLNLFQMSTSKDGGKTWGAAKTTPDKTCVIAGQPLVQPNGTVIVPIDFCFEDTLLAIRSTDGGKTWTQPAFIAQILNNGHSGAIRAPDLPTAEIDKSGRVYVVWTDCKFEARCNTPIGNNDLLISSSADGVNWTVPKRIPAASIGSGFDFFTPGLAVDRSTSGSSAHLGLAYYYYPNSICDPTTCQLNVGFISSTNGGKSWSSPQQLAGPMTLTWLPLTTQGFMVADYISTSIVPRDDDATPVFMVANAPTPPPNCSDLTTGNPGQGCDQAAFTTSEDLLKITGGSNASHDATPLSPVNKSVLSSPATAF